jgi:hypothetical protein
MDDAADVAGEEVPAGHVQGLARAFLCAIFYEIERVVSAAIERESCSYLCIND